MTTVLHITHEQAGSLHLGETIFVGSVAIQKLNGRTTAIQAGTSRILELTEDDLRDLALKRLVLNEDKTIAIMVDPPNAPPRFYDISTVHAPYLPLKLDDTVSQP